MEGARSRREEHGKKDKKEEVEEHEAGEQKQGEGEEQRGGVHSMSDDGRKILAACLLGIDVTELYSPERVNAVCSEFGLERGSSFDLRTGWDFNFGRA